MHGTVAAKGLTEAWRGTVLLAGLAFALGACGLLPPDEAPAECGWPPGTELAFAEEASLVELGLEEGVASERGMAYVSAEPITFPNMDIPPQRWFCLVSARHAGYSGYVPDDWQPPR